MRPPFSVLLFTLTALDKSIQFPSDGGVPVGHDVLVAHGRHGGRVAQPIHHLTQRAAVVAASATGPS
jgi:hypothetical protein